MEKHNVAAPLRSAAYSPTRLLAIHSGVLAGISLVLTAISYILSNVNTGDGLSAMGPQAALSTARLSLWLILLILTPFWSAGVTHAAIRISRGQEARPSELLGGFRMLRPLLTFWLLVGLQYICRVWISELIISTLIQLTPLVIPVTELLKDITAAAESNPAVLLSPDYLPILTALTVTILVTFLILACPIFYRYRMTKWLLMDGEQTGAIPAMFHSRILMQRRCMDLAKLDLHFWWYYLLLVLGGATCFGNVILSAAGVALPFPDGVAFWLFPCAGLLIQLTVKTLAGPAVAVTYALRYERYLHDPLPEPPQPKEKPVDSKDLPWTY